MQITDIGGSRGWLDAPAAASLRRVDAAIGRLLDVNSAGRTRAEQEEARRKYEAGGAYAALPGTSPHEFGNAVDTDDRFIELMAEHGWSRPLSSEPWHFVYYPARDKHINQPVFAGKPASGSTASPVPEEEDDMIALRIKDYDGNTHLCTLGLGVFRHLIQQDDPERIKNIVRSDDAWTDTDLVELPRLLKTYGCRGAIWRCEKGVFTVVDSVETQNAGREVLMQGGMWSAVISS